MIPETITIPTAAIVRFALVFFPTLFSGIVLGWLVGASVVFNIIKGTGHVLVRKTLGKRKWWVIEKIKQESVKSD